MQLAQQMPRSRRKSRSPNHRFFVRPRPWQIQPFMIAPVLPGETLQSLRFQARVVTDPIQNRTIGWWDEYYFFYVKLRDLIQLGAEPQEMLMDPAFDVSLSSMGGMSDMAKAYFQATTGGTLINWVDLCLDRVTECYFRREGETRSTATIDGLPSANANFNSWIESALPLADLEGLAQNPDLTSTTPGEGDGTAAVTPKEIAAAMEQYEWARSMLSTDMTFEDFCADYGFVMPRAELHCPELIRYVRSWQYPSNTINPSDGAAKSAVSWSHQASAGKKVLFKEPGFIYAVTVSRPKCYFKKLNSQAVSFLNGPQAFLAPSLINGKPDASFIPTASGEPPFDFSTVDGAFDIKDLYLHGDQFLGIDISGTATDIDANLVDLPSNDLTNKEYPSSTDADNLFVTTTAGVGKVEKDGIVSLRILGRQEETSPRNVGAGFAV